MNKLMFDATKSPWRDSATLLLVAALGIISLILCAAWFVDLERGDVEGRIVRSALNDALEKLANGLAPNTYWDIAYDHLSAKIDPDWARANLGPYANQTSGASVVLVFDDHGFPTYAYKVKGQGSDIADYEHDPAVVALEQEARISSAIPPRVTSGFVEVNNHLYLGVASAVVPNDVRAKKALSHHSVELYLEEFSLAQIRKVQTDFGLSDLNLTRSKAIGSANTALRDAGGAPVGYISWRPKSPGTHLVLMLLPAAALCFVAR